MYPNTTPKAVSDLLPCPFCGAEAKITKGYWKVGGWHPPKIMCENKHTFRCNSDLQAKDAHGPAAMCEILTAWNTRTDTEAKHTAAVREAVRLFPEAHDILTRQEVRDAKGNWRSLIDQQANALKALRATIEKEPTND